MAEYLNKTGSVTYTVITDTHCYPHGSRTADIDLGDNTNATNAFICESMEENNISKISIYGNHDVAQLGHEGKATRKGLQTYADTTHKVLLIGLDCAESFNSYKIASEDIVTIAEALEGLATDWDVIILTHVPLFPACSEDGGCWGPEEIKKWDRVNESIKDTDADIENNWMGSPRKLIKILAAF